MDSITWPTEGISYGGDYNPEQWSPDVWDEDVSLMKEAGVNLVSIGMFSWALMEIDEGEFDFGWLDQIIDLLHANGIAVDLGTPTASPPAWFFAKYPESRIINREGVPMGFGSRGMASHASPAYRAAIARIAGALAERYAHHPAVVMWHIHNEFGVPAGEDYSPAAAESFRAWLRDRYTTLDALNAAWGTTVWSQTYRNWDHINPPSLAPSVVNPTQRLDFARFTDERIRECFSIEKDAIRAHSDKPITTNFMTNQSWNADLWKWAELVDIVSDDHYLDSNDPEAEIGLSIAADLNRSLGGGRPWMLMEHSTSAVNWQERNIAKRPDEMARNSLAHVARGADSVMFFQWRAARYGQEKFHSTMLPHGGTATAKWREVVRLGQNVADLAEVKGSTVHADVAVLWDFESMWAQGLEWRPTVDHTAPERTRAWYEGLWRDGVTVDFVHPSHDLSGYKLVVAPAQYMLSVADADNLNRYVEGGGTLIVSYFSATVDEFDAVHHGGFLAPLRPALGVAVEEFLPLRKDQAGALRFRGSELTTDVWHEHLRLEGAEAVAEYTSGPGVGLPAVTRHAHGSGIGWYVSARIDVAGIRAILAEAYLDAGVEPVRPADGVELVVRHGETATYTFAINHSDSPADVPASGTELLSGDAVEDSLKLDAGSVAVVATPLHK